MLSKLKYVVVIDSNKTAQILARYRPIAPKPPDHETNISTNSSPNSDSSCMPLNIRDSAYLRTVWPQLQSRSTRGRKRGRTSVPPPLPCKRSKPAHLPSPIPNQIPNQMIIPVEKNLVKHLELHQSPNLFTPKPIRLVSSSILIQPNSTLLSPALTNPGHSTADEIEKGIESQTLPVLISDSKNQVRLANSAYKRLIGQPECNWLESITACNRICGEVTLKIPESVVSELASSSKGVNFCLVVIEWGNSEYKSSITTSGEAVRLRCESRDYVFAWRFHTQGALVPAANF